MVSTSQSTILIVEDNPVDVLLIERALRKMQLPYPHHVVSDGEAAVRYLAGSDMYADRDRFPLPVIMLLDLKLPRLSGLEVLDWLASQPLLKRLPVVILTSSVEQIDVAGAYDRGANSYLVKPVAFDDLRQLLHHSLLYWLQHNEGPLLNSP